MSEPDDVVPVSVRLGDVVPPDDPEDWRRPLTWIAAVGMLAAPAIAAAWFWLGPPTTPVGRGLPGTYLLAIAVAAGGVVTGVTQQGALRAVAGTVGAALFAALGVVIVGALAGGGGRSIGIAPPPVAHATLSAVAGMLGALGAAAVAPASARLPSGLRRAAIPALAGIVLASVATLLLLGREP